VTQNLTNEAFSDYLIEVGKAVYRVSQKSSICRARVALVLPTKSFAIHFILFGIALEKEQESEKTLLSEKDLLTYWKSRTGERQSLMYVTPDKSKRTCLRNGILQEADSPTGLGLRLEDATTDRLFSLKFTDLCGLADPVDPKFTTSTHAKNVCANSRDFLTSCLGGTIQALSLLRNVSNLATVTTSSLTRLHNEGMEKLDLLSGELRLEDIVRMGHKNEKLPPSVAVSQKNPDDPNMIWLIDGEKNCDQNKRTTHAGPTVYLLTRRNSESQDIAREFASQFQRKEIDLENEFIPTCLKCKPMTVEQIAWV